MLVQQSIQSLNSAKTLFSRMNNKLILIKQMINFHFYVNKFKKLTQVHLLFRYDHFKTLKRRIDDRSMTRPIASQ